MWMCSIPSGGFVPKREFNRSPVLFTLDPASPFAPVPYSQEYYHPIAQSIQSFLAAVPAMYDQMTQPERAEAIQQMIDSNLPIFSRSFDRKGPYYDIFVQNMTPEDNPGIILFTPVLHAETKELIGSIATEFHWLQFYTGIFPERIHLIDIVVENTCGQSMTFKPRLETFGFINLDFVGFGDYHVANYDAKVISKSYEDFFGLVNSVAVANPGAFFLHVTWILDETNMILHRVECRGLELDEHKAAATEEERAAIKELEATMSRSKVMQKTRTTTVEMFVQYYITCTIPRIPLLLRSAAACSVLLVWGHWESFSTISLLQAFYSSIALPMDAKKSKRPRSTTPSKGDGGTPPKKKKKSKKKEKRNRKGKENRKESTPTEDVNATDSLEETATEHGLMMSQMLSTFSSVEQGRFASFTNARVSLEMSDLPIPLEDYTATSRQAHDILLIVRMATRTAAQRLVSAALRDSTGTELQPHNLYRAWQEFSPNFYLSSQPPAYAVDEDSAEQERLAAEHMQELWEKQQQQEGKEEVGDEGNDSMEVDNDATTSSR